MANYYNCKSSSGHRLRIKIPSTGTLYLIRDKKVWYTIPKGLRNIIIKQVKDVFTFSGKKAMILKLVNEGDQLQTLNFADAVIRLYKDKVVGQKKIWDHYKKQEKQIKSKYIKFEGKKWSTPDGDFGNAMENKRVVVEGKNSYLVCLTEGAVYFEAVKAMAGGLLLRTDNYNYNLELSRLPLVAQKKVAYGIGNSLAHEARHQLNLPKHALSGIGMDANRMPLGFLYKASSTFSSGDQEDIKREIKNLHLMQCSGKTVSIKR